MVWIASTSQDWGFPNFPSSPLLRPSILGCTQKNRPQENVADFVADNFVESLLYKAKVKHPASQESALYASDNHICHITNKCECDFISA